MQKCRIQSGNKELKLVDSYNGITVLQGVKQGQYCLILTCEFPHPHAYSEYGPACQQ